MSDETTRVPGRHPMRRLVTLATTVVVVSVSVAACSLPVDERVTPIDQADFPSDLTETTTTTSTTTTVPESTLPTGTVIGTAATSTTAVPVVPIEPITVYYARGITDVMQAVEIPRALGTPVEEIIPLLERPTGIREAGLTTALLPGLIDLITFERGVATVTLDQDILDRMSNSNQQRAIAQIVLTLTSFVTTDAGAIGFVRFEVDGEGISVGFVPGLGGTSEPGEPLHFTDFATLIATTPQPTTVPDPDAPTTTTPTTTSTTTTTVADGEPSGDAVGPDGGGQ